MTLKTRAFLAPKVVAAVAFLVCASLLVLAAPAGAAVVTPEPIESMQVYETQLAGGQVAAAVIKMDTRSIHLTLTNGKHVLVHYAHGQEPTVVKGLYAKGIAPTTPQGNTMKDPKPVKHKLRYIAGGLLIVIILIVVGVLVVRRRRAAAAEY